MAYIENVSQFENEIRSVIGGEPGPLRIDGDIHRFSTNGKLWNKSGWYAGFSKGDFVAGAFGDWRADGSHKWSSANGVRTEVERLFFDESMKKAEQKRVDASEKAKRRTSWIWKNAKDADTNHPYLLKERCQTAWR
jgi:putative DNA primase/helicase